MGSEAQKTESLSGLRSAAPFIRNRLWDLLDLKTVPELAFELDRTLEQAARIDAILERIQEEGGAGPGRSGAGEGSATRRPDEDTVRDDPARD
jgi:ribosome-binding factor A